MQLILYFPSHKNIVIDHTAIIFRMHVKQVMLLSQMYLLKFECSNNSKWCDVRYIGVESL